VSEHKDARPESEEIGIFRKGKNIAKPFSLVIFLPQEV
jgi:hypothetical protein